MIIHILTILFVVLFWNTSISISCWNKSIVLPLSLVILSYIASLYIIVKGALLFQRSLNSWFSNKTKIEVAKDKCAESILAYITGDEEYGNKLWKEAAKYLSQDKLFLLLGLVNVRFSSEVANECVQKLPGCSLIAEYFSKSEKSLCESSSNSIVYSKSDLADIVAEYQSPWAFRALIGHYLNNDEPVAADDVLKRYAKSDNKLSGQEWKHLKARVFAKEAELETNKANKMKLLRKANRLDKSFGVLELVKYHKSRKEFTKARKCIEEAWPYTPSVKLGKIYTELDEFDNIPIHKFQHAKALSKLNENHPISHILVATYAMESELWAIALEYLNKFKQNYPALACMLLARLEAKKSGNSSKMWQNIEKAFVLIAQSENIDVDGIV